MTQKTMQKNLLKPIGNRVIAKRTEQEETTKGGILLPESAKQKQETAVVIAVGKNQTKEGKEIPMPVSVGDTILMDKYAAQEVTIHDEEFIIVKADDIIAIVEN